MPSGRDWSRLGSKKNSATMDNLELIEALLRQTAAVNDAYATVFPYADRPEARTFLESARQVYASIAGELLAAVKRLLASVRVPGLSGAPRGPKPPKRPSFEKLEADWISIRDQAELLMSRANKDRKLKNVALQYERAARDFALYFWVQLETMGLATDEMVSALRLEGWLPRADE